MRNLRAATLLTGMALVAAAAPSLASATVDPTPTGEWLAGDLHVHTTYSHDSWGGPDDDNTGLDEVHTLGNTVAEQFAHAALRGLDYLAITDHNDVRSASDDGFGTFGVVPVPGYEKSLDGHAQMLGATRVYERDRDGDGDVDGDDVSALAEVLRDDGGVFQVNHPAEGFTGRELEFHELDWGYGYEVEPDTVEVWNINRLWQPPMPSASSNDDAVRYWEGWLDRGARIGATGGSDNHSKLLVGVQGPGQPTTWVFAEERTTEAILEGVRAGRTFVSHQPPAYGGPRLFLEGDADGDGVFESMVGDVVPPGSELRVRVEGAPGSMLRVVADGGEDALEPILVASALFVSEPFTLPAASWVRAQIEEPDGRDVRRSFCDPLLGDSTTYCRNQLAVLAMTSAIYQTVPTTLAYTGATTGRGETVELAARLTTVEGGPVTGREVTFVIGTDAWTATTDTEGRAAVTASVPDHGHRVDVSAGFAGDDRFGPSTVTATIRWGQAQGPGGG